MTTIDWVRTLRTILVAVLLFAALLAALLGMIGAGPMGMRAHQTDVDDPAPPDAPAASVRA